MIVVAVVMGTRRAAFGVATAKMTTRRIMGKVGRCVVVMSIMGVVAMTGRRVTVVVRRAVRVSGRVRVGTSMRMSGRRRHDHLRGEWRNGDHDDQQCP